MALSVRFPHQNLVHTSPFLHTCRMTRPSHSSRFYQRHCWLRNGFVTGTCRKASPIRRSLISVRLFPKQESRLILWPVDHIATNIVCFDVLSYSLYSRIRLQCGIYLLLLMVDDKMFIEIRTFRRRQKCLHCHLWENMACNNAWVSDTRTILSGDGSLLDRAIPHPSL